METTFSTSPVGPFSANVGMWQGDIIIKSALDLCLRELRANPDLIEDCLASLTQDTLTAGKYGSLTIEQCKRWFADTSIDVLLGLKFKYLQNPAIIAIELGDETENEATIGDKNYDPLEDHPRKPGIKRAVESLHVDASYTVAIFAQGEPEYMLFLQALVLFQLLRRKEDLFDARGFAVSKFQMGTASLIEPNTKEMIYLRTIKLNGKARHVWPKKEGGPIESVPVAFTDAVARDPLPLVATAPVVLPELSDPVAALLAKAGINPDGDSITAAQNPPPPVAAPPPVAPPAPPTEQTDPPTFDML